MCPLTETWIHFYRISAKESICLHKNTNSILSVSPNENTSDMYTYKQINYFMQNR